MAEWWSIEVFSGDKLPASGWRYAYEDELTEAAITHGALYYEWHDTEYGVIFEILFPRRRAVGGVPGAARGAGRPRRGTRPGERAAHLPRPGRRGGRRKPRKPKPAPGAAALELEEPRRAADQARAQAPLQHGSWTRRRARSASSAGRAARRDRRAGPTARDDVPGAPGRARPEPVSRDIGAFDRSGESGPARVYSLQRVNHARGQCRMEE